MSDICGCDLCRCQVARDIAIFQRNAAREAGNALRDIVARLDKGFATVAEHAEYREAVARWDEVTK